MRRLELAGRYVVHTNATRTPGDTLWGYFEHANLHRGPLAAGRSYVAGESAVRTHTRVMAFFANGAAAGGEDTVQLHRVRMSTCSRRATIT